MIHRCLGQKNSSYIKKYEGQKIHLTPQRKSNLFSYTNEEITPENDP